MHEHIVETFWDSRVFGIPTYEITALSEEVLTSIREMPGHFTVRVNPLASKQLLHEHGFYYCDTLIQPHCTEDRFVAFEDGTVHTTSSVTLDEIRALAHGAFTHGRFHRDFNIRSDLADSRYDRWLQDLFYAGNVFGLCYATELAGFFGVSENEIVLHALSQRYRQRGLAKYFWTAGCRQLFKAGHAEIASSISASNVAVLNVYASLGFRFRNPRDVYHRFNT